MKFYYRVLIPILLMAAAAASARADIYLEKEWTYRLKPDVGRSLLYFSDDSIILENSEHVLCIIDRNTGTQLWQFRFGDAITTYKINDSTLAVLSENILHGIDIREHRKLWSVRIDPDKGAAPLMISDDLNFISFTRNGKSTTVGTDGIIQKKAVNRSFRPMEHVGGMELNPNIPGGTIALEDKRVVFTPSDTSRTGWTFTSERLLAKTALPFKDKLFLISADGSLLILDATKGALLQSIKMTDFIDMRFWDEKPANINNYANAALFTDGNFLFLSAPSSLSRFRLLAFPKELTMNKNTGREETTAEWALSHAITQWDSKNYASAVKLLTDTVTAWPDSADARLFLGMAYSSAGKTDEAINELEKAHRIARNNPDIASNLAGNYYVKIFSLDPSSQADKILELYAKVRELQPADPFAYTGPAEMLIGKQDFDGAVAILRESFKHAFIGPGPGLLMLSAFYMADHQEETQKLSEDLIRLFPDSDISYIIKGKALCKHGMYNAATKVFEAVPARNDRGQTSMYPRLITSGWQFFFGNALGLSGRYQDGIRKLADFVYYLPSPSQFDRIKRRETELMQAAKSGKPLELASDIPERFRGKSSVEINAEMEFRIPSLLSIAHFQYRLGKTQESLKTLKQVSALAPASEDPETLSYLGYLTVLNNGNLAAAKQQILKALKTAPDDPIFLRNYAVCLSALKQYDLAEQTFKKAIAVSDSAELLHFEYGCMLLKLGKKKAAAEQFRKELALTPDLDMAKQALNKTGM